MKTQNTRRVSLIITCVVVLTFLSITQLADRRVVEAQQPARQPRTAEQAFKNIQVIKTMPASQLQSAMSFMAASLGVDCSYCHTPPAMEKDDKATKQTARRMLIMMNEINKNFGDKTVVNCATVIAVGRSLLGFLPCPRSRHHSFQAFQQTRLYPPLMKYWTNTLRPLVVKRSTR